MGRSQVFPIAPQEFKWQIANDKVVEPVFDAYSFFEFTPEGNVVQRYKSGRRSAIKAPAALGGLSSSADGTIILGNEVALPKPGRIGAWYLNTGGSVGLMRDRGSRSVNISNADGTGRYVDGIPSGSSFYIGVQADDSNDEIFTYGAGNYGRRLSSGPLTIWSRDDQPRRVLSGAGQDFVLGGWGRDTIAPGLDMELISLPINLNGLRSDYDKLIANDWSRVLGTKPSATFKVPGIGRGLNDSDSKSIEASAIQRKAYAGGSMQDIIIGGPHADVLIGDRIAGTEGGILSYPDYKSLNRAPDVERRVNELIGFSLKTTSLAHRDPNKIASYNILNDLYRIDWKDSKNSDVYYHNNWWPFGDFVAGLEGDDVIYGDDTESDPSRLIALKAMTQADGTIRDQLLVNDSLGETQILKSDPLFKNRTWDGTNNTNTYLFGNDVLIGGDGNDRIFGGFGGDLIIGGRGVDFIDTGEAILAPGYKPFYGPDIVWGDLPGQLKGDDLYPDIFNIGPLYLSETEMKNASSNPDAKTLQEMQAELNNATAEFNKNSEEIKKALKIAGGIAKVIPKVGGVFSAMFKVGSLFLSKRSATQLIQDDSSPVTSDATVFIRDFDPLDVINLPFTEIFADNKPIKATQVRLNVEALPIGDRPFTDPLAFNQKPINQASFVSNKAIEIKLQSDANKPQVSRVVIERPTWLDDWARSLNPSAIGDPLTNSNITNFLGYGVKRTKVDRDSNPNNPANKLPQGQELYNTVFTFALPEALEQIALQNGQTPESFWDTYSPLAAAGSSASLF
jgi:hypothetical protein